MKQLNKITLSFLLTMAGINTSVSAQELLQKADAVSIALENNYDIRAAKNNLEIAKNNSEITNSGYLPSLSGSAGANYTNTTSELVFASGADTTLNNIAQDRLNAGLSLDYTVFDGFGRKYNFARLKETYNLTDLEARSVMENTLVNIFTSYYEIARLTQNLVNQESTLQISRDRLQRAKYSFDYGQNTQLDVLNAEVDYNTDSINFMNLSQLLSNEKHNLNLLLARDVYTEFEVDTTLVFAQNLVQEEILANAQNNNSTLLQQESTLRTTEYDIKINDATILPRVGISAGYNWADNNLGPGGFVTQSTSSAVALNATLTWNIWDGGISNTRRQNSRIAVQNQELALDRTRLELQRNVSNSWTAYETALFVMQAQQKNLETNQRNFSRTREQFSLGQVTSIEFRQAQLNLLTAQLNYSQARYSAKNAELALLQLSGEILDAQF